jgi:hypothetical protein
MDGYYDYLYLCDRLDEENGLAPEDELKEKEQQEREQQERYDRIIKWYSGEKEEEEPYF